MDLLIDLNLVENRKPRAPTPRPPWAIAEWAFVGRCDACQACIGACVEGLLRQGDDGRPETDFRYGGCDFCGACADACPDGALRRDLRHSAQAFRFSIAIGADCLAQAGEECRTCQEFCDNFAIQFAPQPDGQRGPTVSVAACSGCGACVGPCPVACIQLLRPALPE